LEQGKIALPPQVTHLHLAALLQSGLALDLPDGSQLIAGVLRPDSPWVGKQIQSRALSGPIAGATIIAVLRGKSVLAARPDTILQPGDRLLVIASAQVQVELAKHLASASAPNPQAVAAGIT
jgi:Trk K+ transport system NAD-binding subunit